MLTCFVVDASVSACWPLNDEGHSIADVASYRANTDDILALNTWWLKIGNVLIMAEHRGRSPPKLKVFA